MSRLLEAALRYAKETGWPVFPCNSDKAPLVQHGVLEATTDPESIKAWWTRWPDANIGCNVGAAGLVVLDFDPGSCAEEVCADLNLPQKTLKATTPRGGIHCFYRLDEGEVVSPSASKIAPHVDVRSLNSYVLLPPSTTPDGKYEWQDKDTPIIYRSDEFIKIAKQAREKDVDRDEWIIEPDLPEHIQAATEWLKKDAKIAIDGQGGDHIAYATAAHLRSHGISQETAYELIIQHWNPRCAPPWAEDELDHLQDKVENGYKYATSQPGNITNAFRQASRKNLLTGKKPRIEELDDGSKIWEFSHFTLRNRQAINHIPVPKWILERAIPENAYCIMYAPGASFKSFLALDMALSIALGFPSGSCQFQESEIITPGPVLYMAGEGVGSIAKRIRGWEKVHNNGKEVQDFDLLNPVPKLLNDIDGLIDFLKTVRSDYQFIVIDTMSRVMQGLNESHQENSSAFTGFVDCLRDVSESTSILVLHHAKKNEKDELRGSSVFFADADAVLQVGERETLEKNVYATTLSTKKMRDAPDQQDDLHYRLSEVQLDQEQITLVPSKRDKLTDQGTELDFTKQKTQKQTNNQNTFRRSSQSDKRRSDYADRHIMIEKQTKEILDAVAGKVWTTTALATAVSYKLENVSTSNTRIHLNDLKTDHNSSIHSRYDPLLNRFK